jgi:hypothetical protein
MSENTKLLIASLSLGGVIFLSVHIFGQLLHLNDSEARLTSLGIPKVLPLDKAKGEQKVILNDPSIQKNWGLAGTGGTSDIKIGNAWDITQGDRRVVVAVIDTGADIIHHFLS